MSASSASSLLLGATLTCALCEDASRKLAVWCMECFAAEKGRQTPFALCHECNIDMHKPAKLATHRRQRFRCNTERMRTAAELRLPALPPDLPPLSSLMCSNCEALLDDHLEAQWCQECALILCKDCSKDLHLPQKKRVHQRYPFSFRFVSALHLDDENGTIECSATRPVTAASSMVLGKSGAASSSAAASSGSGSFKAAATTVAKRTAVMNMLAGGGGKAGAADPSRCNPGIPGDVIQISEPALTGTIECSVLSFKNTFNHFDTIGLVQVVQICCGHKHAGAVTAGGSLFMWGQNSSGELGVDTGDAKEVSEPQIVVIPGSKPVRMVAAGHEHSACITMDNCAYSWGSGLMGILGHASDINRETPTEINLHWNAATSVDPNERLVWVAAGPHNTGIVCQGRADKRQVYVFGAGDYGTLGTGNRTPSLQPQLIAVEDDRGDDPFPPIRQLSFGTNHTVAVAENGNCYSWGSNQWGALGYEMSPETKEGGGGPGLGRAASNSVTTASSASHKRTLAAQSGDLQLRPRCVDGLRKLGVKVVQASCGELSTSVLTEDGAVYSWGSGETHLLGIMDNVDYFQPVRASVLGGSGSETKAVSLAVGASSCAAVTESGDVYMWGWSVEAPIPTLVSHLRSSHMQSVAIGAHDNVVCLTGVSNEYFEWRFAEEEGQVADAEPKQNRALRGKRLVSISVGKGRCAAVTAAGALLEWGSETRDPDAPDSADEFDPYLPRELRCLWSIADVRCSAEHSVALTREGKVLTWGLAGGMGRLGLGQDRDVWSPALVEALKEHTCVSIAIGPGNTGATTREFGAFAWGAGNSGQLGNNDIHPLLVPTRIAALQHVECVQMAFGNRHLVVIAKDGGVWTSGDNGFGQLGLGRDAESKYLRPQLVDTLGKIQMVEAACGDNVTMVLSADGRLFAFGAGETNQIPGHSEDVHSPVQIRLPFESEDSPIKGKFIREISVANINCAAIADNGMVWTWGFALGEAVSRVDFLVREGLSVNKVAMGPSYMLMSV